MPTAATRHPASTSSRPPTRAAAGAAAMPTRKLATHAGSIISPDSVTLTPSPNPWAAGSVCQLRNQRAGGVQAEADEQRHRVGRPHPPATHQPQVDQRHPHPGLDERPGGQAARRTVAATSRPITRGEVHPDRGASLTPRTRATSQAVSSPAGTGLKRSRLRTGDPGTHRNATRAASALTAHGTQNRRGSRAGPPRGRRPRCRSRSRRPAATTSR